MKKVSKPIVNKPKYVSGGRVFLTLEEAVAYANFIAKISGLIIGVEKLC